MTKYVCDRCEANVEQDALKVVEWPSYNFNLGADQPERVELCRDCRRALYAFSRRLPRESAGR